MRILLVEDDEEIARRLSSGLKQAGFTVERAADGEDGYTMGCDSNYAAAVLDLGLPKMQGVEVLRRWREAQRNMPVLILTARGTWAEKVDGLNAGADDYITKPFHIPEVAARLRALIRRASGHASATIKHNAIELDTESNSVTFNGKPVQLTARELKILNYFLHRIGRIISQTELIDHIYEYDDSRESNTIEVYISRLRRKFGAEIITTVRGLGYRMD